MMKAIVIASVSLLFGGYASALSADVLGSSVPIALYVGVVAAVVPPGIAAAIQLLKAPLDVSREEDFSANHVMGYDHGASSVGCGCLACADRDATESFEGKALRLREQADANGFSPEAYELAAEMRGYYNELITATFPERVALDMVEEEYGTPLFDAWCYEELDAYEPRPRSAHKTAKHVEQPRTPDLLSDTRRRHDQVSLAYSDAERDIDTLLNLPGLFDLNEEPARTLVNALGAAQDLASSTLR